jgi:hypothetical protein
MRRLALAALSAVVLSTPAFACGHSGLHVGVGPLYLGIGHYHPCPAAVAVVPVPPLPAPPALPVAVIPVPVPEPMAMVEIEPPLPPPPMVVAPVVIPAPVVVPVPPPPPVVAAPIVVAPPDEPQRLAVKWMPGFSAPVAIGDSFGVGQPTLGQSFGIEYRLSHYFALRGDLEMRSGARSFDVPGLKFSILPHSRLRPFVSGGLALGQSAADPNNGLSIGFVGAAGLDLILFKYLFVTGEVRYRNFPADCCSLPRISGLVGIGASFF